MHKSSNLFRVLCGDDTRNTIRYHSATYGQGLEGKKAPAAVELKSPTTIPSPTAPATQQQHHQSVVVISHLISQPDDENGPKRLVELYMDHIVALAEANLLEPFFRHADSINDNAMATLVHLLAHALSKPQSALAAINMLDFLVQATSYRSGLRHQVSQSGLRDTLFAILDTKMDVLDRVRHYKKVENDWKYVYNHDEQQLGEEEARGMMNGQQNHHLSSLTNDELDLLLLSNTIRCIPHFSSTISRDERPALEIQLLKRMPLFIKMIHNFPSRPILSTLVEIICFAIPTVPYLEIKNGDNIGEAGERDQVGVGVEGKGRLEIWPIVEPLLPVLLNVLKLSRNVTKTTSRIVTIITTVMEWEFGNNDQKKRIEESILNSGLLAQLIAQCLCPTSIPILDQIILLILMFVDIDDAAMEKLWFVDGLGEGLFYMQQLGLMVTKHHRDLHNSSDPLPTHSLLLEFNRNIPIYVEGFIKDVVNHCYEGGDEGNNGEEKPHPILIDIVTKSIIPHYLSLFKSTDLDEYGLGVTLLNEIARIEPTFGGLMIEAGLVDVAFDHIIHQPLKEASGPQSYDDYSVGHCGILFRTLCKGGNWDLYDMLMGRINDILVNEIPNMKKYGGDDEDFGVDNDNNNNDDATVTDDDDKVQQQLHNQQQPQPPMDKASLIIYNASLVCQNLNMVERARNGALRLNPTLALEPHMDHFLASPTILTCNTLLNDPQLHPFVTSSTFWTFIDVMGGMNPHQIKVLIELGVYDGIVNLLDRRPFVEERTAENIIYNLFALITDLDKAEEEDDNDNDDDANPDDEKTKAKKSRAEQKAYLCRKLISSGYFDKVLKYYVDKTTHSAVLKENIAMVIGKLIKEVGHDEELVQQLRLEQYAPILAQFVATPDPYLTLLYYSIPTVYELFKHGQGIGIDDVVDAQNESGPNPHSVPEKNGGDIDVVDEANSTLDEDHQDEDDEDPFTRMAKEIEKRLTPPSLNNPFINIFKADAGKLHDIMANLNQGKSDYYIRMNQTKAEQLLHIIHWLGGGNKKETSNDGLESLLDVDPRDEENKDQPQQGNAPQIDNVDTVLVVQEEELKPDTIPSETIE